MGRYISTTGTAGAVFRQVSNNYVAKVNDRMLLDSSSIAFTVTLPAPGTLLENDTVQFLDIGQFLTTNNVTVDANGGEIMGDPDLILNVNGTTVTLVYTGVAGIGWFVSA